MMAGAALFADPASAQGTRATITGTVRDSSGAPRGPVTVVLTNLDTQVDRRTNTDASGAYIFGGLTAGRYQIKVEEAGFAPFTSDVMTVAAGDRRTQDVTLRITTAAPAPTTPPPPPPPAVTAGQGTRGTITGRVTVNGAAPPGPVTVILTNIETSVDRRTNTAADGTYIFGGLTPGRYRVRVEEPGVPAFTSPDLTIAAGDRRTQDVALGAAAPAGQPGVVSTRGTITGRVTRPGGLKQPVTVKVINLETEAERQTATDAQGNYTFSGLTPGRYRVRVDEADLAPYASEEITIAAGARRELAIALQAATAETAARATAIIYERVPDYIPAPDRWRLQFPVWDRYPPDVKGEIPFEPGPGLNPYKQNKIKGDYPIIGNRIFFNFTGVLEAPLEFRRVPTIGGVSTERPFTEPFFGKGEQYSTAPSGIASFELFKGDTAFRPRDWALRVTPVFNVNYLNTKERNIVDATPEEGRDRRRQDFAIQEAFGEYKLADVSRNYDFVSVRVGIQPFTSDFRGFLFRDTNLGARLFGNFSSNKRQWNVAYFDQLEKETNSDLNLTKRRNQKVIIANAFFQDFLTPGYTISPSFHMNMDEGEELFYDENGFLVRPSPIGQIVGHTVKAYYAGFGGDGHWGRLNISHQFYQAFGQDDYNGIAGQKVDINAQFAAAEASIDKDWWRLKGTVVFASGDDNALDDKAKGFDAIVDNPNIAGGPFSFWNRQGIRLTQTFLGLVGRNSILPSLRSSKTEGQASFVNPGLLLYNVGWDAELTTKMKLSVNVNYLQFAKTEVLSTVLFQETIEKAIGLDYSAGLLYRPFLNDNVVITAGASFFEPGKGFKNIFLPDRLYTPFVVLTLTY
jgi:carboxypeptidase family protein